MWHTSLIAPFDLLYRIHNFLAAPQEDDDDDIDPSLLERNLMLIFEGPDLDDTPPIVDENLPNEEAEAACDRNEIGLDDADFDVEPDLTPSTVDSKYSTQPSTGN